MTVILSLFCRPFLLGAHLRVLHQAHDADSGRGGHLSVDVGLEQVSDIADGLKQVMADFNQGI